MKRVLFFVVITALTAGNLPATEGQPLNSCDGDLVLLTAELAWNELDTEVENPTPNPQSGGLAVDFFLDGVRTQWWFELGELPAESTWRFTIRFPGLIGLIGVDVCAQRPGGIVDAPDPVARNVEKKKKK